MPRFVTGGRHRRRPGDRNLTSGLSDASTDLRAELDTQLQAPGRAKEPRRFALIEAALLALAVLFFALHFVHLSADFPNHSPWMDWSKYTDEGWYGDAAIRQVQLGHWYVRGDFNPAVALPVWPAIEYLLFRFTGVSLVAARALSVCVFGGILLAAYLLLKRCSHSFGADRKAHLPLAPAVAVGLLAASPFCFAFTRLAILEPLLVLLTLLALLAASSANSSRMLAIASLGLLIPLMILTKTTAVFLLPSIVWMLWAACAYKVQKFIAVGLPAAALAGGLWAAYFLLLVRPHFLEDYRYLFSANAYTGMTRANAWSVLQNTFADGMWMGRFTYPLALAAVVIALLLIRRFLANPLVPSLLLWASGYAAFLAYHNNLQPRYYLVVAVPLTLLVPVVFSQLIAGRRLWLAVGAAGFAAIFLTDAAETVHYVRTPEYTFTQAAKELSAVVLADKQHNPLVLSISGSDLSLMTGLPSICDDFGTMALENRVALYRPGWYATWNQVDDDKMDALSPLFHLERVATFMAYDDPERNLLILYRLDPPVPDAPDVEEPRKQKRKPIPRQLQTKMGQQPSASQLEH